MLGYICKYTPVEIFEAMDTEIVRIEPSAVSFTQADTLMHSNICSFAKGVLETFGETDYEGLVFTTCCDSMRRLYDVLKRRFPEKFFYMLDLPRKVNRFVIWQWLTQTFPVKPSMKKNFWKYADGKPKAAACANPPPKSLLCVSVWQAPGRAEN